MGGRATGDGRYEYWFPLVLLGFGLLALLGWDGVRTTEDFGWFAYAPASPDVEFYQELTGMEISDATVPLGVGSSRREWAVLITAILVGTVAWYAVRARRAGRSVLGYVAVAVGGSAAIWLCHVIAGTEGLGEVGLPLLALGALAGAYFRLGTGRRTAAVISVVCLGAGAAVVLGAWLPDLVEPVLVAGGLLGLAWFERSRLVAVVACLVPAALLVFPDGVLRVLVSAVIVLAAAIVALVRRVAPA